MSAFKKTVLKILMVIDVVRKIIIRVSVLSSLIVSASQEGVFDFEDVGDISQNVRNNQNNTTPFYEKKIKALQQNTRSEKSVSSRHEIEKNTNKKIVFPGPHIDSHSSSVPDIKINNQQKVVDEDQSNTNSLNYDFNQDSDEGLSLENVSSQKTVSDVIVSGKDRAEIKNLVRDQLQGKLSDAQITIVQKVTDSYLEQLFKKLLKRSIKGFIRKIVNMIFTEVRSAQKKNKAISDRDMWIICKNIYDKELAIETAKKTKNIKMKAAAKKSNKKTEQLLI